MKGKKIYFLSACHLHRVKNCSRNLTFKNEVMQMLANNATLSQIKIAFFIWVLCFYLHSGFRNNEENSVENAFTYTFLKGDRSEGSFNVLILLKDLYFFVGEWPYYDFTTSKFIFEFCFLFQLGNSLGLIPQFRSSTKTGMVLFLKKQFFVIYD